jgi:hypothetical protein
MIAPATDAPFSDKMPTTEPNTPAVAQSAHGRTRSGG